MSIFQRAATSACVCLALLLAGCSPSPPRGTRDGVLHARFDWFEYSGADPAHVGLKQDEHRYLNPVLGGFYSDPSLTRVGDDYYLVTSTFAYFPGIPVFHSRDLVSWTQIGNAIDRPDQLDFGSLGLSRGVFAPAITYHAGIFYILNTCVDCGDNFLITASNPAGPWSDPVWLPDLRGAIDPSLFFDEDGSAWIVNNGPPEKTPQYDGHRAIWVQRFDPATKTTIGPRKVLVNGGVDFSKKPIWIEGPHLIRHKGWVYLICAEGGTAEQHSQVVLRSRSPEGPFTPFPGNPILTQRDLPRDRELPITSAGHADFVQTPSGQWWATFLAVRPYNTEDMYNTGREVFLMPVDWSGDWPRITSPHQAIPYTHERPDLPVQPPPAIPMAGSFTVRDEFDSPELAPYWMMMRNPRERWYDLTSQPGALTLTARPVQLGGQANPSYLGRRQQHLHAQASTLMHWQSAKDGDRAGLAAVQNDDFWFQVAVSQEKGRRVVQLIRRAGSNEPVDGVVIASALLATPAGAPIRLRIVARGDLYDFDYNESATGWTRLAGDVDGTVLSTRKAGGFVGVTLGPFAISS